MAVNIVDAMRDHFRKASVIENLAITASEVLPESDSAEVNALTGDVRGAGKMALFWEDGHNAEGKTFSKCVFEGLDLSKWCFDRASFFDCIFRDCILPVDITSPMLGNVLFERVQFTGRGDPADAEKISAYAGCWHMANISTVDFINCNLTCFKAERCSFSAVAFRECCCIGADFSCCSFDKYHFLASDFTGAKFVRAKMHEGVALTGSIFRNTDFTSAIIEGLHLSSEDGLVLEGTVFCCANICEAEIKNIKFIGLNFDRTIFSGSSFNGVSFVRGILKQAWFDGCLIKDAVFDGVKMSGAKFPGAELSNVYFLRSDITQSVMEKTVLLEVGFSECVAQYCYWTYCTFKDCRMVKVDFTGSYWHGTDDSGISRSSCNETAVRKTDEDLYQAEHFY